MVKWLYGYIVQLLDCSIVINSELSQIESEYLRIFDFIHYSISDWKFGLFLRVIGGDHWLPQ